MPIYEYFCSQCKKEFELMRPISQADEAATCPDCGSKAERMVSVFASKSGFYIRTPSGPAFRKKD